MGGSVVLVPGRVANFKVTTADDFAVAEALARA
jgi:2-C-methyl-D-erythritol 4-phosphate cytidylyltransferase